MLCRESTVRFHLPPRNRNRQFEFIPLHHSVRQFWRVRGFARPRVAREQAIYQFKGLESRYDRLLNVLVTAIVQVPFLKLTALALECR
jgi:hypothetical protein